MEDRCQRLDVELPIPMPTWNRILAMQHFERMKLRDLIHQFVSLSLTHERGWLTRTDSASKQHSMLLLEQTYLQTIRPNKSRKLEISNLKASLKKRS